MQVVELRPDQPTADEPGRLIIAHLDQMAAQTPSESVHAIGIAGLDAPDVAFFSLRVDGLAVAIGAIKDLGDGHGELKSMHVAAERRGTGLGRMLLVQLMQRAQDRGMIRLSLETGATEPFTAARGLYAALGFRDCAPFGAYAPDPHSVFMTRVL
ncbi:MAG: GNAT family N-acetyltransferase [Rhodobacteraceae bacterium]|nr:GNAT family N-acetyltransferase [Paracoccaceae bacterium]